MANKDKAKRTETVNPYTFIPLRGYADKDIHRVRRSNPAKIASPSQLYTGVLKCEMEAMTEIALPDSALVTVHAEPGMEGISSYPFFRVAGQPVIPGSSIRGVVRSVFEMLTNSCMRVNDSHFHAQSARKNAGLLMRENGEYVLYKATRYPVLERDGNDVHKSIRKYVNGDTVLFEKKTKSNRKVAFVVDKARSSRGYFLRVNEFKNENSEEGGPSHPSVFEKGARIGAVGKVYIDCLDENIDLYDLEERPNKATGKREQKESGKAYRACFEAMKKGERVLPVWYLKEGDMYEFAPSQISRSVYAKRPSDFFDELGLSQCEIAEACCPACNLFGMVSEKTHEAKAGRVRFADAQICGSYSMRNVVFPATMGPKTSAFEFYLQGKRNGKGQSIKDTFSFGLMDEDTKIAGRKMYWHHQNGLDERLCVVDGERPDLQSEYEIVSKGAKFCFDVFFDGVTQKELNQLAYSLTVGEYLGNTQKLYCHKIGHGKPLGLGSIKISISSVQVRTFDGTNYGVSNDDSWKMERGAIEKSLSTRAALKSVMAFDAVAKEQIIDYPRDENGDIFGWFADNRDNFGSESAQYVSVLKRTSPGYDFNEDFISESNYEAQRQEIRKPAEKPIDSRWAPLQALKK